MSYVIKVENLGKKYIIGHQKQRGGATLRDAMTHTARGIWQRIRHPLSPNRESIDLEDLWALKDVNFEVQQGERIGIIGANGAGKSTLLKVLSRITEPTTGKVRIKGRVSSLLEVGTGFHPELTGRENIFLNGAILGMIRQEIRKKFDEIVAFAELEKFLDTPVKRYSSGMYVRLAFAVAAHLEPEILIVDEVLAVGDAAFKKKCLGKMENVAKEGRTVLFVSHNMEAISTLCQRCIVLSGGRKIHEGLTTGAINEYLHLNHSDDLIYVDQPSSTEPRVTRIELCTTDPNNVQRNGEPMSILFEITTPKPIKEARLTCQVINSREIPVGLLATFDSQLPMCREPGVYRLRCHIPKNRLYMDKYTLRVRFARALTLPKIQQIDNVCPFEVVFYGQTRDYPRHQNACVYTEDAEWEVL